MSAWIKSLRLSVCVLASFLAITGFTLVGTRISWVAVMAVFFIASATMLQNDWRDRFHDIRKGKVLAYQHAGKFLASLSMFWLVSGGLIALATVHDTGVGVALAILAVAGVVYSETRMIPFVPIVLVSLASASPVALPLAAGVNSEKLWLLFLSATLVVFAREITKDLDDKQIDSGYKWTIPLAFGEKCSRIPAAIVVVAGLAAATKVSLLILPAASLAVIAAGVLVSGAKPSTSRKYLDAGMAFAILTLMTFG